MSVPDLLTINKESVYMVLASVSYITQTLIPEPYRLYNGDTRGLLDHATGLYIANFSLPTTANLECSRPGFIIPLMSVR